MVYCAEQPDNKYPASNYIIENIDEDCVVEKFSDGILKGISSISMKASALDGEEQVPATLKLIPYYAWNNRGDNITMNVWFARNAETAVQGIIRTVGNIADVTATYTNGSDDVLAIADGKVPSKSFDTSILRWTSWAKKCL